MSYSDIKTTKKWADFEPVLIKQKRFNFEFDLKFLQNIF